MVSGVGSTFSCVFIVSFPSGYVLVWVRFVDPINHCTTRKAKPFTVSHEIDNRDICYLLALFTPAVAVEIFTVTLFAVAHGLSPSGLMLVRSAMVPTLADGH